MAKCPAWREGDFGSYDRCYATKEMETCECLGNEAFCGLYPEKRKAATEPKYGGWKETGCNTFCRSCGEKPLYDYFGKIKLSHYCPNCGVKMEGGK